MSLHLVRELDKLKRKILALSAIVEENVKLAVQSVQHHDAKLASQIIESDVEIDQMEVEVEEDCLKILALHQPVAIDLRFIVAVLKINSDLERIGDLAVNIAEHAAFLASQKRIDVLLDFPEMAERTQAMLRKSLDALVSIDDVLAQEVCASDDDIDAMNREMYDLVKSAIHTHPEWLESLLHLLSVSRHLERIADHATNIAEDVIYMINGQIIRHRTENYIRQFKGHDSEAKER